MKGFVVKGRLKILFFVAVLGLFARVAQADERLFTYVYDAAVLPEGSAEFEQWITNQSGREDGDYSAWNFRSEIEYGMTERLQTALYLNWDSVRKNDENDTTFKGVSAEAVYQLLNPNLDPIGLALYGEYTTEGVDHELEGKLLVSKAVGEVLLAANAIYEAEFEREDGVTEREAVLAFTAGAAWKFDPHWSVGLELRNKSAYPGGLNLSGQEFQTWSVGPNLHYGAAKWWSTLTVLPQIWGNGDGSRGNRQLEHEENVEVRLLVGVHL